MWEFGVKCANLGQNCGLWGRNGGIWVKNGGFGGQNVGYWCEMRKFGGKMWDLGVNCRILV